MPPLESRVSDPDEENLPFQRSSIAAIGRRRRWSFFGKKREDPEPEAAPVPAGSGVSDPQDEGLPFQRSSIATMGRQHSWSLFRKEREEPEADATPGPAETPVPQERRSMLGSLASRQGPEPEPVPRTRSRSFSGSPGPGRARRPERARRAAGRPQQHRRAGRDRGAPVESLSDRAGHSHLVGRPPGSARAAARSRRPAFRPDPREICLRPCSPRRKTKARFPSSFRTCRARRSRIRRDRPSPTRTGGLAVETPRVPSPRCRTFHPRKASRVWLPDRRRRGCRAPTFRRAGAPNPKRSARRRRRRRHQRAIRSRRSFRT